MAARTTIVTLRAFWTGDMPRPGTWFAAPNGRTAFRVIRATPSCAICAKHDRAAVPTGAMLRAWVDISAGRPQPAPKPRHYDHLALLLRRGAITERQFAAAARFRDTLERASPALPVSGSQRGSNLGQPSSSYADAHLRAGQAAQRAFAAIGAASRPVVTWIVAGNGSVAGYAVHAGTRETTAADRLRAGLARLEDHYNPPVTGRDT